MAGTLLHITLAEQALHAADIDPQTVTNINNHIDDFNLGAVLLDLPYYEHLVKSGLYLLARLEVHYSAWGTLFHLRSPSLLARVFLDSAEDPSSRALSLGLLTHLAVDLVFHREIHRRT
ncbi:MAG: zinc dependent phospholipase C family protein, partial [Proteobacteria bacterium]|nr:zinc dependent phospholipase C family protein [Pseudomonadota bacterium]